MTEPSSTRDMAMGQRDGVQCYSHNHRLFAASEPGYKKPQRQHDQRQLAHVPFGSTDVPASTSQVTAGRRRTLPVPPKHLPTGLIATRETAVEHRSSKKENYGILAESGKHETSLHRDSFKCDMRHIKPTWEGEAPLFPDSETKLKKRRSKYSVDEGNMDFDSPALRKSVLARPPWDGMDTSSVAGAPLRPDVMQGAKVDHQAHNERNFIQSLRSDFDPLVPTAPPKIIKVQSSNSAVFDRLSNPKKFGIVQRNRFDKEKREAKDDDTLNKCIAGTMSITRGDYKPKSNEDMSTTSENIEEDDKEAFFDKMATPRKVANANGKTAYEMEKNARRAEWGADTDLYFKWQSGNAGLGRYPASRANAQSKTKLTVD